jgi:acyl dehydratase
MIRTHIDQLGSLVGQHIGTSDWFQITQDHIDRFADLSGDHQWIHVDVERAGRERGGTIAHGHLILSMIPTLGAGMIEIDGVSHRLNYGLDKVRFISPAKADARIRLHQTVLDVSAKSGGTLLRREYVIEIEGQEKPACVSQGLGLLFA